MAKPQVLEGTSQEIIPYLQARPVDERFRLTPLPDLPAEAAKEEPTGNGSLFDLLGDYIGSVEGNGESNAENHSELFKDYVQKKQKEGRL